MNACVRIRNQLCESECSNGKCSAATRTTTTMMMTIMTAVVVASVATMMEATTIARSRSMAQCHFAHASYPCSPRSSPPTPTLTICPHRAPSRGVWERLFPHFGDEQAHPLPSLRLSMFALFRSILRLLGIFSSSVIFLYFELPSRYAFFNILR